MSSDTVSSQSPEVSEQMQVRLDKRARIIADGGQAYPVDLLRDHTLAQIRQKYTDDLGELTLAPGEETTDEVTIGGRVVFVRNTGKLCFASLQDGFTETSNGERLQVMLSKAEVGDEALAAWKSDVDLGDHVWVRGVGAWPCRRLPPWRTVHHGLGVADGIEGPASPADSPQGPVGGVPGASSLRRPGRPRRVPSDGAHPRHHHPRSASRPR